MQVIFEQITPFWCFSTVFIGAIIGVVGGIVANRTDRRIDRFLDKYSERRRKASEKQRLEFERMVDRARTDDAYRDWLLAKTTLTGVRSSASITIASLSLTLGVLFLFMYGLREYSPFLPFGLAFSMLGVFGMILGSSSFNRAARNSGILHAASKDRSSENASETKDAQIQSKPEM